MTFVEGEWGGRPPSPWALDEDVLVELGTWQRALHDVSRDVVLPTASHGPSARSSPRFRTSSRSPTSSGTTT
ncbi:hypothetical protein NKG05_13400 [Oerskovia sp. M15]